MDAQDFRSLQEVYMDIYNDFNEDYKPWDFGPRQKAQAKHNQLVQRKQSEVASGNLGGGGTATRANRIASVGREMRTTLDRDSAQTATNPKKQGLQPGTERHTAAAMRGAGGGMTARKKFDVKPLKSPRGGSSSLAGVGSASGTRSASGTLRYTPGAGGRFGVAGIGLADEYDLYDLILSHLLDEGYAETTEAAEVIMVNMSEDWRESIVEEILEESTLPDMNRRKNLTAKARRLRRSWDYYTYGGENEDPEERKISTSKGEGGITRNPRKLRKQKAMGEHG